MLYREFGRTGLKVSALGFGAMRLPMTQIGAEEYVDIDKAVETIHAAFRAGVNYIDCGFLYCNGESEMAVGRALKGWRDKVIVTTKATKQRMANPGDLRRMLDHQLRKLDLEYLDFYCFHGIGWDNFHEIDQKTGWLKDMLRAKDEGLFRRIGFSFHDQPEGMKKLVDAGLFEMVTCQYNYLDQKNAESMAYAHEKGLGVVVMGPVGGGRLAGMPGFLRERNLGVKDAAALALRFVLSNPSVQIALSGMGSVQMVEENVAAASAGPLDAADQAMLKDLIAHTQKLAQLYCTGCAYCMPCPRGVNIPARFEAMNLSRAYGMDELARKNYAGIRAKEARSEGQGICIECGACVEKCPQKLPVIEQLKETEKALGLQER